MKRIVLLFYSIVICGFLSAQSDDIYTESYFNETNGPGYAGPFSDVVAANLNAQLFPFSSPDSVMSFHIGVIGVRSIISNSMKTHMGTTIGLDPEQTLEVPTIFGSNDSVLAEDENGNIYLFPGGFALRRMTFLVPQVSVSGIWNTDISFRYITLNFDGEFEDLDLFGIAARHHIGSYLGLPDKVDVAIGYAYNRIEADAKAISNKSHYGFAELALESKGWRLFAHGGYVSTILDINYQDPEFTIDFDSKGTNNIRYGIGAGYAFSLLNIGVQIDASEPLTYSAYVGLKI